MKESELKPNQFIVISKEASVRSLWLEATLLRPLTAHEPRHHQHADYSRGISSGTTNMPAVYSIWK